MWLLDEAITERNKYINAIDLINYIAYVSNEFVYAVVDFLTFNQLNHAVTSYYSHDNNYYANFTELYSDLDQTAYQTIKSLWHDFHFDEFIDYAKVDYKEVKTVYFRKSDLMQLDFITNKDIDFFDNSKIEKCDEHIKNYLREEWQKPKTNNTNKQAQLNQANAKLKEYEQKPLEATQTAIQSDNNLTERNELNYLKTIGLLLELLTKSKGIEDKPPFQSEAVIISHIIEQGLYGQGRTTLEHRFRDAKKALEEARK